MITLRTLAFIGLLTCLCLGCGDDDGILKPPVVGTWEAKLDFGGIEGGSAILPLPSGELVIVGSVTAVDLTHEDLLFFRTDAAGDVLSSRTLGFGHADGWRDIVQIADGYLLVGRTNSRGAGKNDVLVARYTTAGDTVWTRTFGGSESDWASSVAETPEGDFVIVGGSLASGTYDAYALKVDASGQLLWQNTFGGSAYDELADLVILPDGAYLIVGSTGSTGAGAFDVYVVKMGPAGSVIWSRTYGGPDSDEANAIAALSDGGYAIAGYTQSSGSGDADAFLLKVDAAGDTLWTRTLGGPALDVAYSVVSTGDGSCVIAGRTESSGAGMADVYLAKFTASGSLVWSRTYGGANYDSASSIALAVDGGLVITGMADGTDVYLIRDTP